MSQPGWGAVVARGQTPGSQTGLVAACATHEARTQCTMSPHAPVLPLADRLVWDPGGPPPDGSAPSNPAVTLKVQISLISDLVKKNITISQTMREAAMLTGT